MFNLGIYEPCPSRNLNKAPLGGKHDKLLPKGERRDVLVNNGMKYLFVYLGHVLL